LERKEERDREGITDVPSITRKNSKGLEDETMAFSHLVN